MHECFGVVTVEEKQAYSPAEVARRWGCSVSHVHTLIARRMLHAINISSDPAKKSRWSVPAASLQAFEEDRVMPDVAQLTKDRSPARRSRARNSDIKVFFE